MGNIIDRSIDKYATQEKITYEDLGKTLLKCINGESFKTEEEKTKYESKLSQKIQSGKKLTGAEMSYIRKNMPSMYASVVRAQNKRKNIEEKCKNAKSKQEVDEIYNNAISQVGDKDPDRELLISAIKSAVNEFKESRDYKLLPLKTDEEEKKRKSGKVISEYYNKSGSFQEAFETDTDSSLSIEV